MSFDFVSQVDPDFSTPEQYFADYANQRRIWLADKRGFDTVQDDEGVVTVVEREKPETTGRQSRLLEKPRRVEVKDLGTSPKGLANALLAMGWSVSAWVTISEVEPVLYVSDAAEGAKSDHRAGDVRYEGYTARRYCIEGRFGQHPVGIQAFYEGKGLLDKNDRPDKTSSFQWCRIRDGAYGIVQTDTVDYTRTPAEADEKGWTNERRIQEGMAMNRRYPAEAHAVQAVHYTESSPMNQWVDLYLDLTKTENGGKRLTRKKKEAAPEPENDLERMSGMDEWSG